MALAELSSAVQGVPSRVTVSRGGGTVTFPHTPLSPQPCHRGAARREQLWDPTWSEMERNGVRWKLICLKIPAHESTRWEEVTGEEEQLQQAPLKCFSREHEAPSQEEL